jgi:hypothetical protein
VDQIQHALALISRTPDILEALLRVISERDVARRIVTEEFSLGETICHLRDIECEAYAVRIQRILNEDNPTLPDIDGGRLAIEREYNRQDPTDALRKFSAARQSNIDTLSSLQPDQWNRMGELESNGPVSLVQLLEMMREHDESHVEEARSIHKQLMEA